MSHKARHARPGAAARASRAAKTAVYGGTAAGIVVAGTVVAAGVPAAFAATAPLSVSLGTQVAGDGSSAVFNAAGDIVLTVGTGAATTGAHADITSAKGQPLPATEPAFKTGNYAAGSPRLVIELSNKHSLWGYPGLTLSGKTGPDAAGMAWAVDNGNTYTDYATAVTGATGGAAGVTVTDAFIVADGDQKPGTADDITNLQYNGQVLGGGVVTLAKPADVTDVLGTAIAPVKLANTATSTVSDPAITYTVGSLPAGLAFDATAGTISGTPASTGSTLVTVTATDAYGDHASQTFTVEVDKTAPVPPPVTVAHLTGGHVIFVNNNDAEVGWNYADYPKGQKACALTRTWGFGFSSTTGSPHVGFTCFNASKPQDLPSGDVGYWNGFAAGHTYDIELIPANPDRTPIKDAPVGWINIVTTR